MLAALLALGDWREAMRIIETYKPEDRADVLTRLAESQARAGAAKETLATALRVESGRHPIALLRVAEPLSQEFEA